MDFGSYLSLVGDWNRILDALGQGTARKRGSGDTQNGSGRRRKGGVGPLGREATRAPKQCGTPAKELEPYLSSLRLTSDQIKPPVGIKNLDICASDCRSMRSSPGMSRPNQRYPTATGSLHATCSDTEAASRPHPAGTRSEFHQKRRLTHMN